MRAPRLSVITTKTGDDGSSRLATGARLKKSAPIFAALGDVDELNCQIGVVLALPIGADLAAILSAVQQHLFALGAVLAGAAQPLAPDLVLFLEQHSQNLNAALPPLQEFILPGGDLCCAHLQLARSVCRRAERHVVGTEQKELAGVGQYLNRLSDLLFILCRAHAHARGILLPYWQPAYTP